jgi:hypothetical protein
MVLLNTSRPHLYAPPAFAQHLLPDLEGLLEERLGLGEGAHFLV